MFEFLRFFFCLARIEISKIVCQKFGHFFSVEYFSDLTCCLCVYVCVNDKFYDDCLIGMCSVLFYINWNCSSLLLVKILAGAESETLVEDLLNRKWKKKKINFTAKILLVFGLDNKIKISSRLQADTTISILFGLVGCRNTFYCDKAGTFFGLLSFCSLAISAECVSIVI